MMVFYNWPDGVQFNRFFFLKKNIHFRAPQGTEPYVARSPQFNRITVP
jgi:hypothetical protein